MAVSKKAERHEITSTKQLKSNAVNNHANGSAVAAKETAVSLVPSVPRGTSMTDDDLIKFHASRIARGWHKSAATILEVSRNCTDADEKIPSGLKERFYKILFIDRTVFCKLAAIGRSKSLHNPEVLNSLPAHYTILHALRLLSPDELGRAITAKVVSNREEAARWASNPVNCKLAAARKRKEDEISLSKKAGQAAEVEKLKALWNAAPELVHKWRWSLAAVRDAFVREIKKDQERPLRG